MDRAGRSRRSHAVVLALLSIAAVSGAWWRPREQSVPIVGVVIITLDTTRADRLPVYGFMDAAMPHLDRLGSPRRGSGWLGRYSLNFSAFWQMAEQQALSRERIHFRFDSIAGQEIGVQVADYVFANFMTPR